jgi:hypothetical protein
MSPMNNVPPAASSIIHGASLSDTAERAALVTEQLYGEHALGEQRAVRLDDRTGAPRQTMDRPREETLARSRLAGDEHR